MVTAPLAPKFEPNPALRVLYSWFFDAIQVDDGWVRAVRDLSRQGSVVYVLRNLNPVDLMNKKYLVITEPKEALAILSGRVSK